MTKSRAVSEETTRASVTPDAVRYYYIETYGCQMNFNDSEIVASLLEQMGYRATTDIQSADLVFINTCSIREKAEETVRRRLRFFQSISKSAKRPFKVGVLGCMAERMKKQLLEEEQIVDMVVGPDAYRSLPQLIEEVESGQRAVNVLLSREETYADIQPVRLGSNGVSAFISIMRGCDNMCSFCVVPFTRGRERSRDPYTIVAEAADLFDRGYREVTLLGQNVDSYRWVHPQTGEVVHFAKLLQWCAEIDPRLRIRFSTSHPKDMTDEVLHTIARYPNICKYIHLPIQSGSDRILELMRRGYTRNWYLQRIEAIRRIIPDCAVSSDIITGFCTETEEDHQMTLEVMEEADFCMSYMFAYSERPRTWAARNLKDDVPREVKIRRLEEVIQLQKQLSLRHNQRDIGKTFEVLIEGDSKRSSSHFKGRNSQNKMVIFPKVNGYKPGDYVDVLIEDATSATLLGQIVSNP